MINVLIPMAGRSLFFNEDEFPFPKPLIEIGNKTLIEHVIHNLNTVSPNIQFIFVLTDLDCRKYYLDSTLKIITHDKCLIVRLHNETKGAACSALMAIKHINNEDQLIIANYDQLFDVNLSDLFSELIKSDAGVITFESVHPRWSYARTDQDQLVIETAEKRPISRDAIAGLYYFKRGIDFVNATMSSIRKDSSVNGNYYIAPTLNELILEGKTIRATKIDSQRYHTFYTPQKIKDYESRLLQQSFLST